MRKHKRYLSTKFLKYMHYNLIVLYISIKTRIDRLKLVKPKNNYKLEITNNKKCMAVM